MKNLIIKTIALGTFGFLASEYRGFSTVDILSVSWGVPILLINMICIIVLLMWD